MTRQFGPAVVLALSSLTACFGGITGDTTTAPPPPPTPFPVTVSMGPVDAVLSVGGTLQFQAVSSAVAAGWDWSVSDPARASVTSEGIVLARQPGSVTISACATNSPSICGVVGLTVEAVPASGAPAVTMVPGNTTIAVGQSVEYSAMAVNFIPPAWSWTSLDPTTATITGVGVVTGRRPGLAVVAACAPAPPRYCGTAQVRVQ